MVVAPPVPTARLRTGVEVASGVLVVSATHPGVASLVPKLSMRAPWPRRAGAALGSGRGEGELRVQTEQRVVERVSATGGGAARTDGAESVWRKGCLPTGRAVSLVLQNRFMRNRREHQDGPIPGDGPRRDSRRTGASGWAHPGGWAEEGSALFYFGYSLQDRGRHVLLVLIKLRNHYILSSLLSRCLHSFFLNT